MTSVSTPPNSSTRKRAFISEETPQNSAKRQRQIEASDEATCNQWRQIDPKKECFLIDELPPADAFLSLNISQETITFCDLFTKFVTDELTNKLFASISDEDCCLGYRANGGMHTFRLTMPMVWQTLAVQVRLIGEQNRSSEHNPQKRNLRKSIYDVLDHFKTLSNGEDSCFVTRCEVIERLIARMVFTEEHSRELSSNFRSLVRCLGQYVAGDEKLFHFTGNSGNVRLVIAKPDRIGFWFYELCGRFANGLPYLLDVFMHNSLRGTVHVSDVVKGWIQSMKAIHTASLSPSNLKCILAMDSYYMDTAARQICQEEDIYYCCSVNETSFATEVRAVRPAGVIDKSGQWYGMYNESTKQIFVCHYDAQKGVGKKYNFSYGFQRCTDTLKIQQYQNHIPAYDDYKTFFECCDNFNSGLKDKSWPYKRGSKGRSGEFGTHHDFLLACVLQNTFNAWHEVTSSDPKQMTFKKFCDVLSDELFLHSQAYVVSI